MKKKKHRLVIAVEFERGADEPDPVMSDLAMMVETCIPEFKNVCVWQADGFVEDVGDVEGYARTAVGYVLARAFAA
jgi:hypothetical protein